MKIITLTLNPALDRTMYFGAPFMAGELNRSSGSLLSLGGKGINVSRVAAIMGVATECVSFCGGANGGIVRRILTEENIFHKLVDTGAETRMNIKMVDSEGVCTEANEAGGPICPDELERLVDELAKAVEAETGRLYVCMGGSIPQGVEKSVYKRLTTLLKNDRTRVILDCDGEPLQRGMEARPYLIKPNLFELSGLVGKRLETVDEAVENSAKIYEETGVRVLCTLGGKGALYASETGVYTVSAPKVELRGFTGAGDTFLASFVCMSEKSGDVERSLAFASSAAAAKVELAGTELPSYGTMDKWIDSVTVRKVL